MGELTICRDARELHLAAIAARFDRGTLEDVGTLESRRAYDRLWRAVERWNQKAARAASGVEAVHVAEWIAQGEARAAWNAVPGRAPWTVLRMVPGHGVVLERHNRPGPRVTVGGWTL